MKATLKLTMTLVLILNAGSALAGWNLDDIKAKAADPARDRCSGDIQAGLCAKVNDKALSNGSIDRAAYDWAQANGWYVTEGLDGIPGSLCKCGCFEASTRTATGFDTYVLAKDVKPRDSILALSTDATISEPSLYQDTVAVTTSGPEVPALYVFALENGVMIKVSQNHGMVLADGSVVAARDVQQGQSFVFVTGEELAIKTISREKTDFDVVNFSTCGKNTINHVIVAEGVLIGDLSWQNELESELGNILLRN